MDARSTGKGATKPQARSRVTNGNKLGPEMDGRSAWARRLRDVIARYSADLGGEGVLTESQMSIIRRVATLTIELERLEAGFCVAGSATPAALDQYQRIASSLRRLLEAVGLSSKPNSRTPLDSDLPSAGVRIARDTERGALTGTAACGKPDYDLARRFAYIITRALREGTELPEAIAKLAAKLDNRIRIIGGSDRARGADSW
jgi:hypothetical protein